MTDTLSTPRVTSTAGTPALYAFPLHGQHKLLAEGYRTRDGHLIEWFGAHLEGRGPVAVVSRPEPVYRALTTVGRGRSSGRAVRPAANTVPLDRHTWRVPSLRSRRQWWVRSAPLYPDLPAAAADTPAIVWNPFTALARPAADPFRRCAVTVLDLLDDWTVHYAFAPVHREVEQAYRVAFGAADFVVANAEGTLALAHRFGRTDAILVPNGCDPERFDPVSRAAGPLTVGYVGKIGKRVDLALVTAVATRLPQVKFLFAGPVLDAEYRRPLGELANVELLGDVHYADVPDLLTRFDVGWVPHRVGEGEVGGDVIKTYEYRAAGLPVLSTPIVGAGTRGLDHVAALPAADHADWLAALLTDGPRVPRRSATIPGPLTWEHKSSGLLPLLDLEPA